jgi:hypothetical protein
MSFSITIYVGACLPCEICKSMILEIWIQIHRGIHIYIDMRTKDLFIYETNRF